MKTALLACLAASPILMTHAAANAIPAPHLDDVRPSVVMARPDSESSCGQDWKNLLRLDGQHLAAPDTTGFTYDRDVKVSMHWAGDPSWDVAPVTGWTPSQISLGCIDVKYPGKYIARAGTLEIFVAVRGVRSNVVQVRVLPRPTAAPTVSSLSRHVFATTERDFSLRIHAANLDDESTVTIGGKPLLGNPESHYAEGYIQGVLPTDFRAIRGRYPVVVKNRVGVSTNVAFVQIVAPPASIAATRDPVQRGASVTDDQFIDVAYSGDAPTSARVKGNGDWMAATFRDAGSGLAKLDVPAAAWTGRPTTIAIEVTNVAGSATGVARIMYMTVVAPTRLPPAPMRPPIR